MDSSHVGSFYSPNSTKVNQIMDHMCGPDVFDQGFNQLPLMIKYIQACKDECYGVYFHEDENGTSSSSIMTYTIYTNSMKLSTDQRYITDSLQPAFSRMIRLRAISLRADIGLLLSALHFRIAFVSEVSGVTAFHRCRPYRIERR